MSSPIVMFRKTLCILFKVSETEYNISMYFLHYMDGTLFFYNGDKGVLRNLSRGGAFILPPPLPPWKLQNSLFQEGRAEPPKPPLRRL